MDRPAIPDDLFRRPADEAPAAPDDELFRRADATTDPEATAVRPVPPPSMPSPAWASRPGTPEADLLPSERLYAPAPSPVSRPVRGNFSGSRGVIMLLVLLVVAAIAGGVLWFTGGGSPTPHSQMTTLPTATQASAPAGKASGTPSAAQSATSTPSATPSDAFPPNGATLCSGSTTVAVNSTTSCQFALNVAAAIPAGSSGSFTVTANSPVTQKDYQMACLRGTYTVCTGGVNALVYVK
jgi:hypothetical protein